MFKRVTDLISTRFECKLDKVWKGLLEAREGKIEKIDDIDKFLDSL
jgi:hypothetical protein